MKDDFMDGKWLPESMENDYWDNRLSGAPDEGAGQGAAAAKKPPRKKKKRRKKHYLLKTAGLIALGAGLYFFLTSQVFGIQEIVIENNSYYTSEQIIEMAGVAIGDNIFETDTGGLKKALMEDPYIINAKTRRELPSTLLIHVSEREEAAFMRNGAGFIIIDEEGLVLREAGAEPVLTELAALTVTEAEAGKTVKVEENAAFTDTLNLMKAVKKSELYFKKIDISNIIIRAYVYDHLICEGTPDNLLENLETLKAVLLDLDSKEIQRGTVKIGGDGYVAWQPLAE
ncbi:MAG: FtsQ-type POTRA domain-containing protein [Clostridiales Family XIII bacterium]|jgi:cell division protein FtsQ|nr:FtsQ-type POTRA domain-containing protein [Clostridiales Family XIII bacterium]